MDASSKGARGAWWPATTCSRRRAWTRANLRREPVPLGELLATAQAELRPLARDHGIELSFSWPEHAPVLDGDGHRLVRAIENLVRNALAHARARVAVELRGDQDRARVSVSDDGPGAGPGKPDLDELVRAARRRGSTGLGLEVARRVVEEHGGSLSVGSVHEGDLGGARFELSLPLPADPGAESGFGCGDSSG